MCSWFAFFGASQTSVLKSQCRRYPAEKPNIQELDLRRLTGDFISPATRLDDLAGTVEHPAKFWILHLRPRDENDKWALVGGYEEVRDSTERFTVKSRAQKNGWLAI